jgi:hypothetical protein
VTVSTEEDLDRMIVAVRGAKSGDHGTTRSGP